jgi:hypothetical protein
MPKTALMTIEARAEELVASPTEAGAFPGAGARLAYLAGGFVAVNMASGPLSWGLSFALHPLWGSVALANVACGVAWAVLGGLLLRAAARGIHPSGYPVVALLAFQLAMGLAVSLVFGLTPFTTLVHQVLAALIPTTGLLGYRRRRALAALPADEPIYLE